MRYERIAGVQVAPLGAGWAAFSRASGETLLLNDEAAAVLEVLAEGPGSPEAVYAALAGEGGASADEIRAVIGDTWQQLAQAGLVRGVGAGR